MSFAPINGLNNYYQTILFGCALLKDEIEKSITWFFENSLQAIGGKSPMLIIAYQDKAIGSTISKVFPYT